jgi:hypothetical protein
MESAENGFQRCGSIRSRAAEAIYSLFSRHRIGETQRMPTRKSKAVTTGTDSSGPHTTEELCLMGPRHLRTHLQFIEESIVAGVLPTLAELADFWRTATAVYRELEVSEPGAADDPGIGPLPRSIEAHVAKLLQQPVFRQTFDTVPVAFGMVELDKMIVSQYSLTRSVLERLRARHASRPTPKQLAEICLPLAPRDDECRLASRDDGEFVFVSGAHDMRFLGATLIDPAGIEGLTVQGHARAVVALSVGFSTNVLNVIRLGNRVVLNNGHHRAYALRAMGLTHVPCVIQVCASHEELREAASREICDNSDLYYESPRPPLLRDFDRPDLACALKSARLQRQVRVRFKFESRQLAI